MRRQSFKIFALFAIIVSCAALAQGAPRPTIKAAADSTTLTMGDRVKVTLSVNKSGSEGELVDMPEVEADYYGLELVDCKIDTADAGNGRQQLTYDMTFQAFYPTELLTLPPFRFAQDGDTVSSDILTFKVLPVELSPELGNIEEPESLTIHPDEGPVTVPARWYDFIPDWIVWVIIAIAAIALAIVLYVLYRKNGPAIFKPHKPIPPYELAVQRLAALKNRKLMDQGQVKQYYTELIDIFRIYLEGRFGINAMEMPSKKILKKIRENKEIHLSAAQMEQVLQLADIVKFAAANATPEEGQRTFNTISSFVESTKPVPEPEDPAQARQTNKKK